MQGKQSMLSFSSLTAHLLSFDASSLANKVFVFNSKGQLNCKDILLKCVMIIIISICSEEGGIRPLIG